MSKSRDKSRLDPATDMLVRWVIDDSLNTVSAADVTWHGDLKQGVVVSMDWNGVPWLGVVEAIELPTSSESSDCDSDDEPLSMLVKKSKGSADGKCTQHTEAPVLPAQCSNFFCQKEVWAACHRCLCFLCFEHFSLSDDCLSHNVAFNSHNVNVEQLGILTGTGKEQNVLNQVAEIHDQSHVETGTYEVVNTIAEALTIPSTRDQEEQEATQKIPPEARLLQPPESESIIALDNNSDGMSPLPQEAGVQESHSVASRNVSSPNRSEHSESTMRPSVPEDMVQANLPSVSSLCDTHPKTLSRDTIENSTENPPLLHTSLSNEDDVQNISIGSSEASGPQFQDEYEERRMSPLPQMRLHQEVSIQKISGNADSPGAGGNLLQNEDEHNECRMTPPLPEDMLQTDQTPALESCTQPQPETFVVDGSPAVKIAEIPKERRSRNLIVKQKRNHGDCYTTEKNKKFVPSRRESSFDSNCSKCQEKGLSCQKFSREDQIAIRNAYFDLGSLQDQRHWIGRYTDVTELQSTGKQQRLKYYLPAPQDQFVKWQVCQGMFLSTVGITERQVRTVTKKRLPCGILEDEKRGGRQSKEKDALLRAGVKAHINRFPRMESHYCRSKSKCQYLSPDLNLTIMYNMYKQQHEGIVASYSLYRAVFQDMNLKFHKPKKDACSICETYHRGSTMEKENIKEMYLKHTAEKDKVRQLKEAAKARSCKDNKYVSAVFDLQQVIYLPKSARSELFYKRRLSNFNFTIFELASRDGLCFLSHEGITKRGACEISSYLHHYLCSLDEKGVQEVELFADGCVGQNKNSIVASMLQFFVEHSISIKVITLNYFVTNHGQSEGDAVHSVIQRRMEQVSEIMIPGQLASIIRMSRIHPRPYYVKEVTSEDIRDWKSLGQQSGILRVRESHGGQSIDWTQVMALRFSKDCPRDISFKMSHRDEVFDVITVGAIRRNEEHRSVLPDLLYKNGPPKVPQAKYLDLESLCTGSTAAVWHPDYKQFYRMLPH